MGVCRQDGPGIVSEASCDDVQGDGWGGRQRQRGARVAQDVHRADRDIGRLAVADEPVGDSLGVDRSSDLIAEDEIVVLVGVTGHGALDGLRLAMPAQGFDGLGVEGDGPLAAS